MLARYIHGLSQSPNNNVDKLSETSWRKRMIRDGEGFECQVAPMENNDGSELESNPPVTPLDATRRF
jgi:hypothetical protein